MKKYTRYINNTGFTLIEVIIALALMSIIGSIVIPTSGIVHRSRLKNVASQISMDISKVRFFAQTHNNGRDPITNKYGYRIVFQYPTGTDEYYKAYELIGNQLDEMPPDLDDAILIRPIFSDGASEKLIKEIQFTERGKIRLWYHDDSIGENPVLIGSDKKIKIILKSDKFYKEVHVEPLTARTLVTD
ncbi:MAG: type II secretion system protein [Epulopiscium sp.]|nr:type II secretion system protein [Candidatus Epulonipiscium sp.]